MVLENPLYQQANTYGAAQDRGLIAAIFDTEGVFGGPAGSELKVSPRGAGASMSVDIAAGRAVVAGDDAANQGSYLLRSTAVENRPIGAAPGSNSRIDLVVAQVRDANVTGGVSSDWDIVVIPGVVAASPVAPTVPSTAIPLAQVLVAAGTVSIDAAKITDRRGTAGSAAYQPKALITRTVLGSPAASVIFNPIPQDYEDLWLEVTGSTTGIVNLLARLNGDASPINDYQRLVGAGTSATSDGATGQTTIAVGAMGVAPQGATLRIDFPAYARTVHRKMLRASLARFDSDTSALVQVTAGRYRSTAAITSIEIIPSGSTFAAGTVFSLYGTKG